MGASANVNGRLSFANVFHVFAKERQNVSTLRIQELTGLSLPSISRILNSMLQEGIIALTNTSKGKIGRASKLYSLRPEYHHVIGVYIDKACTFVSIGDFTGKILSSVQIYTKDCTTSLLERISKEIDCLLMTTTGQNGNKIRLGGISICISAMVMHVGNSVRIQASEIDELNNVDVVALFEKRYHTHVFVERDTNACLISKLNSGGNEDYQNVALVSVGMGIGCAMSINGMLYKGTNGFAGEVRNMLTGSCTRELYASSRNIWVQKEESMLEMLYNVGNVLERAFRAYQNGAKEYRAALSAFAPGDSIAKAEDISLWWLDDLARQGEATCISLLQDPINCWASIIINLCCCIAPEAIFLGGQLGVQTGYICNRIQEIVREHIAFPVSVVAMENDVLIRKAANDHALVSLYETIRNQYLTEDAATSIPLKEEA